jgi:hypothetical protein
VCCEYRFWRVSSLIATLLVYRAHLLQPLGIISHRCSIDALLAVKLTSYVQWGLAGLVAQHAADTTAQQQAPVCCYWGLKAAGRPAGWGWWRHDVRTHDGWWYGWSVPHIRLGGPEKDSRCGDHHNSSSCACSWGCITVTSCHIHSFAAHLYYSLQCFLVRELHSHLLLLLADTWLQDQQATHQRNEMMVRASMLACLLSQVISVPTLY